MTIYSGKTTVYIYINSMYAIFEFSFGSQDYIFTNIRGRLSPYTVYTFFVYYFFAASLLPHWLISIPSTVVVRAFTGGHATNVREQPSLRPRTWIKLTTKIKKKKSSENGLGTTVGLVFRARYTFNARFVFYGVHFDLLRKNNGKGTEKSKINTFTNYF